MTKEYLLKYMRSCNSFYPDLKKKSPNSTRRSLTVTLFQNPIKDERVKNYKDINPKYNLIENIYSTNKCFWLYEYFLIFFNTLG